MIHTDTRGACVFATLDSPTTRNALSEGMVADLLQAIGRAEGQPATRALVLRGSGGHFCSGGDFGRFRPWRHQNRQIAVEHRQAETLMRLGSLQHLADLLQVAVDHALACGIAGIDQKKH